TLLPPRSYLSTVLRPASCYAAYSPLFMSPASAAPYTLSLHDALPILELQLLLDRLDDLAEAGVRVHLVLDRLDAVDDGGVVAPAEVEADGLERVARELLREPHRDLAGLHDLPLARAGADEVLRDLDVVAHHALDLLDGEVDAVLLDEVAEHLAGEPEVDLPARERRLCLELDEGPFELADVALDVRGDVVEHFAAHLRAGLLGLPLEDGDARLELRRLHVGREPPLEPREQPLL